MNSELLFTKDELYRLINGGENSSVEFKSDEVKIDSLAKEIVAFSNTNGGIILLGVEDDGKITGLSAIYGGRFFFNK